MEDPAEAARLTAAGGQCTPGIDTEEEFEPPRVFISSAEAVEIVRPFFEAEEPASVACTYLIAKAAYKWREVEGDYRDDISAIVVYLPLFDD